jgi:hypothetical protein
VKNKLGFLATAVFTFGMLFVAFWMIELAEAEQLSRWAATPISLLCILLAMLGAEFLKEWPD